MAEYGWIPKCNDKRSKAKSALRFYGVVSSDKVPLVEEAAFRRSQAFTTRPWALAAWLRKGELDAQEITTAPYQRESFFNTLHKIRSITNQPPSEFVPVLVDLCARAGVAVVFVRELPKTGVSGATRWISPSKALIQLSLRYKADDMFWFAFFHECGHVYLEHAKRDVLLEGIVADKDVTDTLDQREVAANNFAMDILIPPDKLERFLSQGNLSQAAIERFASSIDIAPGIVIGRLQHEKKLDWHKFRALKRSYSWEEWPAQSKGTT